jgi:mono/diheme cytochrome c family protein
LTSRQTFCVVITTVLVAAVGASTHSFATASPTAPTASELVVERQLYRRFCGQCHALAQARSAGFGSSSNGLGTLGGPSFNELRVPYLVSVIAVKQPTGGHEVVRTRITSKQLSKVATFIARVTNHHPIPALPTDG